MINDFFLLKYKMFLFPLEDDRSYHKEKGVGFHSLPDESENGRFT